MMDTIIHYICIPLGLLMKGCWMLVKDYGLAILLFTLATKIVLLPVSIWIHKNSIQMVKLQPEINNLKVKYQGNADMIAEEQMKLFKREHYHPMLSLIPLILQIVLLLGVVHIIYHPLTYLFGASESSILAMAEFIGANTEDSAFQLKIVEALQNGTINGSTVINGVDPALLTSLSSRVGAFDLKFLGLHLSTVPTEVWGVYTSVPLLAGASSWLLCHTQNLSNVIQHEQGNLNKYGIMALSVALSLYLGLFVPIGIALYWIASNLFSIAQMYLLNLAINPKKYVDYEALEESRQALANLKAFGQEDKKSEQYRLNKQREKADIKRFKSITNKHIVFYSEKSGFYKYYKDLIAELLKRSNLSVHYITNDPNDVIFEVAKDEPRIKPYYVSLKKTATLMMLIETDMFVMTTPDLNKYYLKRSFIKSDIEYVYVPHDMMSVHMSFREGAFDAFDTVLCTGPHVEKELRAIEKVYDLKAKTLVHFGYPLADTLEEDGKKAALAKTDTGVKEVLIAPSWQEDNLLDSCVDGIIQALYSDKYHITVRPHPEYAKRFGAALNDLVTRYADYDADKLTFELNFSANKSIYSSDVLITDWSGVATEFCFATKRPAVFVNTKMKCPNPNYTKIDLTPVEISLRNRIGVAIEKDEVGDLPQILQRLEDDAEQYRSVIEQTQKDLIFNHGTAAKAGADYIMRSLAQKKNQKR